MSPSEFVSKFWSAVEKFPGNIGWPLFTAESSAVNSRSSMELEWSLSKVSKQNRKMSSLLYMQYVSSTATYSSNSMLPEPSRSMRPKSWSVSGVRSSPNMAKNSAESIVPLWSTSTSVNLRFKRCSCRCDSESALTASTASGRVMTTPAETPSTADKDCRNWPSGVALGLFAFLERPGATAYLPPFKPFEPDASAPSRRTAACAAALLAAPNCPWLLVLLTRRSFGLLGVAASPTRFDDFSRLVEGSLDSSEGHDAFLSRLGFTSGDLNDDADGDLRGSLPPPPARPLTSRSPFLRSDFMRPSPTSEAAATFAISPRASPRRGAHRGGGPRVRRNAGGPRAGTFVEEAQRRGSVRIVAAAFIR
mmetsp:Transcript_1417/g.5119  ORF Transcript_1417/g.5119 Transcript_1417/m.5119 type:complete len:363 (-) Transcript_1417:3-1091(-)